MMTLKERPGSKTIKRPHRVARARASSAHAPAARTVVRSSPLHSRRVLCESDEALSIALDRMINEVLREQAASTPARTQLP